MRPAAAPRNVKLLALFNFFNDFRLFGPILIIYFADISGSFANGGLVLATTMISSALFEIPTGVLSDRMQRRRVALLGALVTALAFTAYAVAPGFEVLMVGAVLEGLGRSLFSGNNDALLWDSLAEHGRESEFHHHSGRVNAGFQIALALSAFCGGFAAGWSMRWAVALSIAPQLVCALVALRFDEPRVHHDVEPGHPIRQVTTAAKNIWHHKTLRRLTFAHAFQYGAGEAGWQLQPSFVSALWPTWAVGIGRGVNHLSSITGFWSAGRVINRFGPSRTLLGSTVVSGIVGLVAFGKPTVVSPALLTAEGSMYGLFSTSRTLMVQRIFTDTERATMGSIGQLLGSLFFGIFAITGGVLADAHGPAVALLVLNLAGMVAIPVYWLVHRGERMSQ
jgi:hypothetical protein